MKQAFWVVAMVIAATLAMPANAQTSAPPAPASTPAPAPESASTMGSLKAFVTGGAPYLGLGVGAATTSGLTGDANGAIITGDSYKVSGKVLGGYQFTPYVGLEAQYADLGSRTVTAALGNVAGSGNTTANQFSVVGTGTMPISDALSLIGKLGASHNQLGGSSFCAGSVYCSAYMGSHTDVMWGAGISFSVNKRLTIRVEYEDFGRFSTMGGPNGAVSVTGSQLGGSIRADNFAVDLIWSF
jgi:hypothetical protein